MSILRADSIRDRAGTGAPDFPNGLTGNVTGTATGLGANATGSDLTLSGNLTVQGTTTTIDTAVTSVDSLAVDGQITGLGNCGIGTNNPGSRLHVMGDPGASGVIYLSDGDTPSVGDSLLIGKSGTTTTIKDRQSGSKIDFGTADTICLTLTSGGTAIFKAGLAEKYENAGTTLGAQTNNPLSDGNVILFTGNESGNNTINFTGVHATLSNGETVSFTAIITPNNSGVINAVQIDGQSPAGGLKWSGGSAPSAGSSGQDIYTFQILKTGTGATDYTVYGAAANYA